MKKLICMLIGHRWQSNRRWLGDTNWELSDVCVRCGKVEVRSTHTWKTTTRFKWRGESRD